MTKVQQILTGLISRLESVIIRVNLVLGPQDEMPSNAARNLLGGLAPPSSPSQGGFSCLPCADHACPVEPPRQPHLWAARQHWWLRSSPSSSPRAPHSQIRSADTCRKGKVKSGKEKPGRCKWTWSLELGSEWAEMGNVLLTLIPAPASQLPWCASCSLSGEDCPSLQAADTRGWVCQCVMNRRGIARSNIPTSHLPQKHLN